MSIKCSECGDVTTFDVISSGKQIQLCQHGNEAGRGSNTHAYDVETGKLHCNRGGYAVEISNIAADIRSQMKSCTGDCQHAKAGNEHVCIPGAKCQH